MNSIENCYQKSNENRYKSIYALMKEFDERAKAIRVMSGVTRILGVICEPILIMMAMCIINLSLEDGVINRIEYNGSFFLGAYIAFVITMFVIPLVYIGNGKRTSIYEFLDNSPVTSGEIFKSRLIILCKMFGTRLLIFVGLQILVMLFSHKFYVRGIIWAASYPIITFLLSIITCRPHKK